MPQSVVVLEHTNKYGDVFYAQYGHINIDKKIRMTYGSDAVIWVEPSEELGKVLDFGSNGKGMVPASQATPAGWVDPVAYLNENMSAPDNPAEAATTAAAATVEIVRTSCL